MTRPWLYDASGNTMVLVRPVGFYRPVETHEYREPGHDAHSHPLMTPQEWWEGHMVRPTTGRSK